jgi:hypothetical protein
MKRVELVTKGGEVLFRGRLDEALTSHLDDSVSFTDNTRIYRYQWQLLGLTIRKIPEPVEFEAQVLRSRDDLNEGVISEYFNENRLILSSFIGRRVKVRVEVLP